MSRKLKDILRHDLDESELAVLVGGYDVVGDIAIVIVPDVLSHRKKRIGEALLSSNGKLRVVARRAGNYSGEFRTIPLEIIAGEKRKETLVQEFGIRLLINPETVYFSVRSGAERNRVASLVAPGESVLVLFSGVGPYPLMISKYSEAELVVGVEKNPEAHRYALKNLGLNKKLKNIELYLGGAENLNPEWRGRFDRVVMPLPHGGERFLVQALHVLKSGGALHLYQMQHQDHLDESINLLCRVCSEANRAIKVTSIVRCGHTAPKSYRICIDAEID
jgi:tRNA (guanine37-N1)-methyltransferase